MLKFNWNEYSSMGCMYISFHIYFLTEICLNLNLVAAAATTELIMIMMRCDMGHGMLIIEIS